MRTFEVVLLVLGGIAVVAPSVLRRRGLALAWLVVLGFAVTWHVVVEGVRWQFVPAGIVLAVLAVAALRRLVGGPEPGTFRVRQTMGVLGLALSLLVGWALPVVELPAGSGPWAVGRVRATVVDTARTETWGPDPGGPRRFVVTAWYPTDEAGESPWLPQPDGFAREVAAAFGLPAFTLGHLDRVRAPVVDAVPLATDGAPRSVVVLSHGWSGFAAAHADLGHDLASRGFVVLAIDHTYAAQVTTFPNDARAGELAGEVAGLDPSILPDEEDIPAADYQAASEELEEVYAADAAALLDRAAAGEALAPLDPADLDLDAVGLVGHSTGGGAMFRLCVSDPRCGAVAGLDPWVEPVPADLRRSGVDVPLLALRSQDWRGNDNDVLVRALVATTDDATLAWAPGTLHRDVTLQPMLSPLSPQLGLAGSADPFVLHDAVEATVGTFFDRTLRDGSDVIVPPDGVLVPEQVD